MRSGPLTQRYSESDLGVFDGAEAQRFVGGRCDGAGLSADLCWELLYRIEPHLYDRLASAERLHPRILEWLPQQPGCVVEVAAGSGRLTLELARRSRDLLAVEPAAPLRDLLVRRLRAAHLTRGVRVVRGFFDALPAPDACADLVIACSALTDAPSHGGDRGLNEMERVCRPGGMVVIVWPNHLEWLVRRGYERVSFDGDMEMHFADAREAAELCSVFYPDAADGVRARRSALVPYELLNSAGPRDLAYRIKPA